MNQESIRLGGEYSCARCDNRADAYVPETRETLCYNCEADLAKKDQPQACPLCGGSGRFFLLPGLTVEIRPRDARPRLDHETLKIVLRGIISNNFTFAGQYIVEPLLEKIMAALEKTY